MTNEEKARELAHDYFRRGQLGLVSPDSESGGYDCAIKMAQWKDEQFAKEKQAWIGKATEWLPNISIEDNYHLWTIQDVKDGDIIVCYGKHLQAIGIVKDYVGKLGGCDTCFRVYCYVNWDNYFMSNGYIGSREIYPATKEQCELLFSKMKEAGYKWDNKNKELIKI